MTTPSNPGFAKIIDAFLESLRLDRGAADTTVEAYGRDLHQLMAFLKPDTSMEQVTPSDLDEYIQNLHESGQKGTSIARKISALRQFFKFCCLEKGLKENPSELLSAPPRASRIPKYLSEDQITSLLGAAEEGIAYPHQSIKKALNSRDLAMVYLIYATGLRVSELVNLTTHQVDFREEFLRVQGKGSKERIVPFVAIAGLHLRTYLNEFRGLLQPQTDHLFVNHRGNVLTRQSFWKTLKTIALQAGVTSEISPHTLRHSFATHLLQSGMNLRSLQALLGHSDLTTTQIYTHIAPEHLKTAHKKFHPRGE